MKISKAEDTKSNRAPEEYFTGAVWMDALLKETALPGVVAYRVSFEPGARTNWHSHPAGQVLYIVSGTCRLQREGEGPMEAGPGAVVHFAAGEKHWHGAAPESLMVHIAINFLNADKDTVWMERVNNEEYAQRA